MLLHMCTINQDHVMYGFYDMKFNRQSFFVILGNFLFFYSLTPWKMKIPKRKKPLEISSFYTSVQKIMIVHYTVPEIWRMTDVIVIFILGYTFPFYPPNSPRNENFKTKEERLGDIMLHKCTKNHDHILYCSWDIGRVGSNCYFSFWAIFSPFIPLTAQKMNISQRWEKHWRYHHLIQVYQKLWS